MCEKTYVFGCGCKSDKVLAISKFTIHATRYCPFCFRHDREVWALENKRCALLKTVVRCEQCNKRHELTDSAMITTKRFTCPDCKERNAVAKKLQRLFKQDKSTRIWRAE